MAAASPTPMPAYGNSRFRHTSAKPLNIRRDSPLSALSHSQGFSSGALPLRSMAVGDDSDDDLQPPPQLSALGRSVLEHKAESPKPQTRSARLLISRNASASNTPARDTTTPAPSGRVIKRVGLQGAPVRRARRTPQSEEEHGNPEEQQHERPPSQDQENVPVSIQRPASSSIVKPDTGSTMKAEGVKRIVVIRDRDEEHVPLAQISANTPHRPAPPPPPKMSVLDAATKAGGAATTKKSRRGQRYYVNGHYYTAVEKFGKGGSAEVYRVTADNGRVFALKKVRLAGVDPAAVANYKGEIDLLEKLQGISRVVRLIDHHVDIEKDVLYVLMEPGDGDLGTVLKSKYSSDSSTTSETVRSTLDITFVRYWWKEMLQCVGAVHEKDIVHSDLKPANFLVVKGSLKLIDFGIAGAIDVDNTINMHRDSHVGTPNYMSPESLQDSGMNSQAPSAGQIGAAKLMKLGKPSDVWSLGCILYQMVYGQPPFGHISPAMPKVLAIINPNVSISYPSTGIGGSKVPLELRQTLKRCLQRDPAKRPTVEQLLNPHDVWVHPEAAKDMRISEEMLNQIIWRVAKRFIEDGKPMPSNDEIEQYAPSFYERIREFAE